MVEKVQTLMRDSKSARWLVLLLVSLTMYAAYFFSDVFSPIHSYIHNSALGWTNGEYGSFAGAYSLLCVWGGLIICGALLDKGGVRLTGTIFVASMLLGAAITAYAVSDGFNTGNGTIFTTLKSWFPNSKPSVILAITGYAIFGLGAEIAGVAVTKSIAKWFKGKETATAMSLQVSIARLGMATAMVLVPFLVPDGSKVALSFSNIALPIRIGGLMLCVGLATYLVFCVMDAKLDKQESAAKEASGEEDKFKLSDVGRILTNKYFLMIALLCVFFYCCVFSFNKFAVGMLSANFSIDVPVAATMMALLPIGAIVFTPIFGSIVDFKGKATNLMILGSFIVLFVHAVFAFAPGIPIFGYAAIVILGIGFSLVPAAMWQSVPRIIPQSKLGTAYSLIYWVQNIGLWGIPILVGTILDKTKSYFNTELLFMGLAVLAIIVAFILKITDKKEGKYHLDKPNKVKA